VLDGKKTPSFCIGVGVEDRVSVGVSVGAGVLVAIGGTAVKVGG
jgi:hypothetical protein